MAKSSTTIYEAIGSFQFAYGASPYWDRERHALVWLDIDERSLHIWYQNEQEHHSWPLPSRPGACIPTTRGDVFVVLEDGCYTVELEFGAVDPVLPLEQYRELNVFSAGCMDHDGRFWCVSSHIAANAPTGKLYRMSANLRVFAEAETLDDCRGIDWSPDGKYGYMSNAVHRCVDRFTCDRETGEIEAHSPYIALRKGEGLPAGLAISSDGDIWICHYGGAMISRWNAAGQLQERMRLPARYVTGATFGGENGDELWITTAQRFGVPRPGGLEGRLLRVALPGVTGKPTRAFDLAGIVGDSV